MPGNQSLDVLAAVPSSPQDEPWVRHAKVGSGTHGVFSPALLKVDSTRDSSVSSQAGAAEPDQRERYEQHGQQGAGDGPGAQGRGSSRVVATWPSASE